MKSRNWKCPACRARFRIVARMAGRRLRCPACGVFVRSGLQRRRRRPPTAGQDAPDRPANN